MGWFAVECNYTPDQVFDMPWVQLVRLSLFADDVAADRERQIKKITDGQRPPRRMT